MIFSEDCKLETEVSLDSKPEDCESSPSSSPSPIADFESEFQALVSEEDKEKKHSKRLFTIPNPASGISPICFTSEESLRIDELLRIDRESMIAFGDTLREKNRVSRIIFFLNGTSVLTTLLMSSQNQSLVCNCSLAAQYSYKSEYTNNTFYEIQALTSVKRNIISITTPHICVYSKFSSN